MTRTSQASASRGFTLVEVLMVVAIIGVLGGAAAVVTPRLLSQSKADSSLTAALSTLRLVQERAVGERRNFDVEFTAPNRIQVYRVAVPGPGRTLVNDVRLETGQHFMQFDGLPDTPDTFGNGGPLAFGVTPTMTFTSEGMFVDSSGDVLNGTVFLGHQGQDATSARAITIFGATGLVRSWRWDGRRWVE
jgi:prepilin-type N-terminal cleavage/methylation domain-containing protein